MCERRKPETLTERLDEIIYEYDLGYEVIHASAVRRTIELIKKYNLDEKWGDDNVNQFIKDIEDKLQKSIT